VHNQGTKKALGYTYGAIIAFGLLLVLSTSLNSIFISILLKLLIVVQVIGSLYMIYVAYQIYEMDASKGC